MGGAIKLTNGAAVAHEPIDVVDVVALDDVVAVPGHARPRCLLRHGPAPADRDARVRDVRHLVVDDPRAARVESDDAAGTEPLLPLGEFTATPFGGEPRNKEAKSGRNLSCLPRPARRSPPQRCPRPGRWGR